ncbi:MAG: DUF4838 domain-containing protein, partial [Planctomycetes bacterium]|nr:DUF4838 domain-containing protein [Planctomycetota bacterium]
NIRDADWTKETPQGLYIAIGKSKLTEAIQTTGLSIEQYVIDVDADRLAIVGGHSGKRGVLYGVYDVLEQLGVRWYRPEPWGWHVPRQERITLPVGRKVAKAPDYVYRSELAGGFTRKRMKTAEMAAAGRLWSVRNRLNGADVGVNPQFGGRVGMSFGHSFYLTIPAEQYFEKHPEYFCLIRGERRKSNPDTPDKLRAGNPTGLQLCLGNPGLQELFAQKIIAQARSRTREELDDITFSVSPNDACPFCDGGCEGCKALDDPRFPELMSNRVSAFVNIVARAVAKAVPGARVSLNVYSSWTEPPTNIPKVEPNVCIHMSLINEWADYSRDLLDPLSPWNKRTVESMRKWKDCGATQIYTYEYWSGYAWLGPLPLVRTMADRCREYRRLNIKGIYNETCPHWGPQGLDLYMCAKLMWDPNLDLEKELGLYYQNYYGPAAAPMKEYHELLMQAIRSLPAPAAVYSGGRGAHFMFKPSLLEQLKPCMDRAQALVKGQALYERRLAGVAAGYEFARRIGEILVLKVTTGTKVASPRWSGKYYLQSAEAERKFRELVEWLDTVTTKEGDVIFDYVPRASKDGPGYLSNDVLKNAALGFLDEPDLLKDFK